jgi:serine/threonine protein kinase/tetratricopeptide (TPR) repeat protein
MQERLGHYRLLKKLGEGGMGVVYAAEDERLGRTVALKTVRAELGDTSARERLRREARVAASITHPNVCQLYEIGESGDELFLAMELLSGEALSERIARGPLPIREAVQVTLDVLAALSALHKRGILHRDIKPSNVFLTDHGAKLLDFGIARALEDTQATMMALTGPGTLLGTPRYMAPEYASGDPIDARADVFSVGALLYEMLSGRPAFAGDTTVRVLHAIMYEQPPVLTGPPMVVALDRVINRALAKQPAARHESAEQFASDLRLASSDSTSIDAVRAHQMSRLIVLPFRMLRADPEIDFLAFSLADAVTTSLSGLGSLVVRSSVTASRLTAEALDLQKIAREADVDVVLTGSILRASDQVRLSAQLAEAPGGAVVWSDVLQVPFSDIFQLHDTLVHRLVDALAIPLTAREHRLIGRDVPATAKAYEFFLRANEIGTEPAGWDAAVDLYMKCLDLDPMYAPAWARLGRVYRLMAKYRHENRLTNRAHAEHALDRALAINPDLSIAQSALGYMEVESGRTREAMVRLLRQAAQVSGDPEIYSALCHVLRYCGLLEASLAAHHMAIRLDPKISTSVLHTWFLRRDYERVVESPLEGTPHNGALSLYALGRKDDALALIRNLSPRVAPVMRLFVQAAEFVINDDVAHDLSGLRALVSQFNDPEGLYYLARSLAKLGDTDTAVAGMVRAVDQGYSCYPTFATDEWLDPLRGRAEFDAALERARLGHAAALADFTSANGERILGVSLANG